MEAESADEGAPAGGIVGKIKRHAEDARAAAREASEEKQAEMLRDWDRTRHREG
jgi:hypothetical protein